MESEERYVLLNTLNTAVLTCFELPPTQRSAASIASRFNRPIGEIENILQLLLSHKYLRKNAQGQLERSSGDLETGDGPSDPRIRKYHRDNMLLAAKMVESLAKEERHYSSLTFSGCGNRIDEIIEEVRGFHDRIANLMDKEEKNDEVFRLSISLFPIKNLPTGV